MPVIFLRTVVGASLLAIGSAALHAQSFPINLAVPNGTATKDAATVPSFDVVSVKPHNADDPMMKVGGTPDGMEYANISLKVLISDAYGIRTDLISGGPSWADSKGFDVTAKVAAADLDAYKKISRRQGRAMLQAILAERFHLTLHKESKDSLVYDLVIGKGGVKMKTSDASPTMPDPGDPSKTVPRGMMMMGPGVYEADSATLVMLAGQLSSVVQHDVRDKTGLTGKYDVKLKWSPDAPQSDGQDNGSTEKAPGIFTAVQEQLGLKLIASKAPVETIVIDHAELPTEN